MTRSSATSKITVLGKHVADQIAAGEVIERPASVLKELVENSLDARASLVRIEIENAGRRLIRVEDDGTGMEAQDLSLSFQRFATSKIRTSSDLLRVQTYGFRGEALASIAAVSRLEVGSKTRGSAEGSRLVSKHGRQGKLEPWGRAEGTAVSVSGLFENTPARLRFLRSDATERHHIVKTINALAMGNLGTNFVMSLEGKVALDTRGREGLMARAVYLMGLKHSGLLVSLGDDDFHSMGLGQKNVEIRGLVGRPEVARRDRGGQIILVNGRWVQAISLSMALRQGFGPALPHGRFPVAVLDIRLDPELIDVNVHPAKREIRFRKEGEIKKALSGHVRKILAVKKTLPSTQSPARPGRGLWGDPPPSAEARSRIQSVREALAQNYQNAPVRTQVEPERDLPGPEVKFLGQLGQLYLLAADGEDLFILDPHAAHERVLYEKLLARDESSGSPSQSILVPLIVEFDKDLEPLLEDSSKQLEKLGFSVSRMGPRELSVSAIPALAQGEDIGLLVRDLVVAYASSDSAPAEAGSELMEARRKLLVSTAACRMAVKDGDILQPEEMEALVQDLGKVQGAYTCPHGRPAAMRISRSELDRRFLRS